MLAVTSVVSRPLVTRWTLALQAALSMEFSRQEYRSGWSCPPPGDLPDLGIEPVSLMSPELAGGIFTTSAAWAAQHKLLNSYYYAYCHLSSKPASLPPLCPAPSYPFPPCLISHRLLVWLWHATEFLVFILTFWVCTIRCCRDSALFPSFKWWHWLNPKASDLGAISMSPLQVLIFSPFSEKKRWSGQRTTMQRGISCLLLSGVECWAQQMSLGDSEDK